MHTTLPGRRDGGQDSCNHTHPNGDEMVSAADYSVVDVLWMTIAFFCLIAWIWPLILGLRPPVPAPPVALVQDGARPRRMIVHSGPRRGASEPDSSPSAPDAGPGVVLGTRDGMPVLTVAGPVDRELIKRADPMLQRLTLEHDGAMVIDVSRVDAVNGALIGLLLRANRRLAWRNRQLIIACSDPEHSRRLRIAGLDELATLRESGRHRPTVARA
jgi:anti-anti-sigma regulatory factor